MSTKLILRVILVALLLGATCSQINTVQDSKKVSLLQQEVLRYDHYLEILFNGWPSAVRHPDKDELLETFDHANFVDICIQDLLGPDREETASRFDKGMFLNATWAAKFGSTHREEDEDSWELTKEAMDRSFAAQDAIGLYEQISRPERIHAEAVCVLVDIVLYDKIATLNLATIP